MSTVVTPDTELETAVTAGPEQATAARNVRRAANISGLLGAFKFRLIKAIDVAGLSFLNPLVRLGYGEEPTKQLREIGRLIVVPALAMVGFLLVWTVVAPKHKTKSGEVPTPAVVWEAARSIWNFHRREGSKELAYLAAGDSRGTHLASAQQRLEELKPYAVAATKLVTQAEVDRDVHVQKLLAPIAARKLQLESQTAAARAQRTAALHARAQSLAAGDVPGKQRYLDALREHLASSDAESEQLKSLEKEAVAVREQKFAPLIAARQMQTKIAEEQQYLAALVDQLGAANRTVKMEAEVAALRQDQRTLLAAAGPEIEAVALRVLRSEKRIETIAASNYAKPWTLPMQIGRSVACVFVGFLMGSALAIPLGVLSGLSRTFMAALTPFIALFKPVSPIVWLPIALILVGGFIPDPDQHWLIGLLADLPLIGWMKINPAFIASAITVAMCSLWATMVNTALGVSCVDKDHLNVARVLRLGFWSRLFKIVIPSALPLIFAGLRISLGVGWMVLIAGELLSSSEGIGKFVWDQFNNGASDSFAKMMVVVFVVGVIGLLLDRIMIVLQRSVSFEESR